MDDRTIFDLSEEEYEDYEKHPEDWEDVTNNTIDDGWDLTHPDSDTYDE